MRNIVKFAVVAVFLIVCAAVFVTRESTAASVTTSNITPADLMSPRTLYVQNCARCHGSNGKAQTALGKRLEADDLTASTASIAKITRQITNGKGKMPSFRRKLTSEQIASLAGYVKSL